MLEAALSAHLTLVESMDDPVPQDTIAQAGISASNEIQLQRFLLMRTEGTAHQIVKGAQADKLSSLEIWRRLATRYTPRG